MKHHPDHLGSTSIVTDQSGNLVHLTTYTPYGKTNYELNLGVSVNTLYTGQQFDREAALYYYNARYYDPALGRFIQPDTIIPGAADSQAYNRYTYCRNNPIMFTDPTGHSWLSKAWNKVQETVVKAVPNEAKPVVSAVAGAIVTYFTGSPEAGGATASFYSAYLNGASIQDTAFATGVGAASGGISRIPGVGRIAAGAFSGWAYAEYYGGDRQKSTRDGAIVGGVVQAFSWAMSEYYNDPGLENEIARGASSGAASGAAQAAINDEDIGKAMLKGVAVGAATAALFHYLRSEPQSEIKNGGTLYLHSSKGENPFLNSSASPKHGNHSLLLYKSPEGKFTIWGAWLGRGVVKNFEGDLKYLLDPDYSTDFIAANLTEKQASTLMDVVARYQEMGADGWTYWNPCSSFAVKTWNTVTGMNVQHRVGGFLWSDPNVVYSSINGR